MADVSLTLEELEIEFQKLTMTMLGLSMVPGPALDASAYKVRVAWPIGGAPAWKITEDITFLQVMEVDGSYNRQRDTINSNIDEENYNQQTGYTRINSIGWVLYGPNAYGNAQKIRDNIFLQEYHDILARKNIYLLPDIPSPRRIPEFFEGNWWKRVDLTMLFNELVVINTTGKTIASAEISIDNGIDDPTIQVIS